MAANGTNQSRLRSVQGGSPTSRGQNSRAQNSNRNAMRGFGPSGSSNQSSGGSNNMFGFSQQYQNPFSGYQNMFGNQNPMLNRYVPPMMSGNNQWQNGGGYAYNLPNSWGGTGLNYGGNTFGGGGNQGGGLPFGIPQSGDYFATLPWNPGSPDGRYGGNVDSRYPTPDEYFGRRAASGQGGGSFYDMLSQFFGNMQGQMPQQQQQSGSPQTASDMTRGISDNARAFLGRSNQQSPPMTFAPRDNSMPMNRPASITPVQGPTTRTPFGITWG